MRSISLGRGIPQLGGFAPAKTRQDRQGGRGELNGEVKVKMR